MSASSSSSSMTTADTWNRQRDKQRLEALLGLPEFFSPPGNDEEGDNVKGKGKESSPGYHFYAKSTKECIAIHYRRIVYGDHGPYIEFDRSQIQWDLFVLNEEKAAKSPERYYDEWFLKTEAQDVATTTTGKEEEREDDHNKNNPRQPAPKKGTAVTHILRNMSFCLMLYDQRRDVAGQKNPPKDGNGHSHNNNRKEGYADYKVGCVYVSPDFVRVVKVPGSTSSSDEAGQQSSHQPAAATVVVRNEVEDAQTNKASPALPPSVQGVTSQSVSSSEVPGVSSSTDTKKQPVVMKKKSRLQ